MSTQQVCETGDVSEGEREQRSPTLLELATGECRYPLGSLREPVRFFCGKPALPKKPYCDECCRKAYYIIRSPK